MATIEARLKEMGVTLPSPPTPVGSYAPAVIAGELLFVSGQLPLGPDGAIAPAYRGKLGQDLFNEAGQEAARLCAINVLAQARLQVHALLVDVVIDVALVGHVDQHVLHIGRPDTQGVERQTNSGSAAKGE